MADFPIAPIIRYLNRTFVGRQECTKYLNINVQPIFIVIFFLGSLLYSIIPTSKEKNVRSHISHPLKKKSTFMEPALSIKRIFTPHKINPLELRNRSPHLTCPDDYIFFFCSCTNGFWQKPDPFLRSDPGQQKVKVPRHSPNLSCARENLTVRKALPYRRACAHRTDFFIVVLIKWNGRVVWTRPQGVKVEHVFSNFWKFTSSWGVELFLCIFIFGIRKWWEVLCGWWVFVLLSLFWIWILRGGDDLLKVKLIF